MKTTTYATDYDEIIGAMQHYIEGSKAGKSDLMRPAFHKDASFIGYAGGDLVIGTPVLFDWIDNNGPAPDIQPRFVSVDIVGSIAVVLKLTAGRAHLQAVEPVCLMRSRY